jgi:hypothetical protein
MDKLFEEYLKHHLSIELNVRDYGNNGKELFVQLWLDDKVISSDSIDYLDLQKDED